MREVCRELVYYLGLLSYFGILMVASVFTGYWLGSFLDRVLPTEMLFTVFGAILGAVAGLYSMYKLATARLDKPR